MDFRINLIKNEVLPAEKRRAVFFIISLYLAASAALLSLFPYRMAVDLGKIRQYQKQVAKLEKDFYRDYSISKDVVSYGRDITQGIVKHIDALQAIDGALTDRVNLTQLLFGLSAPLPQNASLDNLLLDNKTRKLTFDIVVMPGEAEDASAIRKIVNAWKKDAFLMPNIKDIESTTSQSRDKEEGAVAVSHFSCRLIKEGL